MGREDLIKLVIWTMKYYGSAAEEKANPGIRLRKQAEHIANVIEQYEHLRRHLDHFETSNPSLGPLCFDLKLVHHDVYLNKKH